MAKENPNAALLGNTADRVDPAREKQEKELLNDIKARADFAITQEKRVLQLLSKLHEKYNLDIESDRRKMAADSEKLIQKLEENTYKKASMAEKAKMNEARKLAMEQKLQAIEDANEIAQLAARNDAERAELSAKYEEERLAAAQQLAEYERQANALNAQLQRKNLNKLYKDFDPKKLAAEYKKQADNAQKRFEDKQDELEEAIASGADKDKIQKLKAESDAAKAESDKHALKALVAELGQRLTAAFSKSVDEAMGYVTRYEGAVNSRLQGTDHKWSKMMDLVTSNLAVSPFVKSKEVLDKMAQLAENGVAYNIEERAFLGTVSEKIASTFDAANGTLLRLIKLQQADTTAARLGMEASLTKFFNGMFEDSSYLGSVSQSITSAILDANSQLSRNASSEFEYTVQKWLGSLYSLGASDSFISQIAQGLNMLGTGDVKGLASNNSLQTLFAMSASRSGLSYSNMLLNGLNASDTNTLLKSMVEYLKDIATNTDNQVVRSAYGDILGLSLSDLRAISNLSGSDISNIYGQNLNYQGAINEYNNQAFQILQRTSMASMLNNVFENAVFSMGTDIATNPATYAMWKMLDVLDQTGLKINIPAISVMGNAVDLNTDVNTLLRLGVGLSAGMSLMGNILSGLSSGGGFSLNAWNAKEFTSRGSGITGISGSSSGVSQSAYVGNSSSSDMKNSSLSSAADDAEDSGKITNKNVKTEYTFDDFYKAVVAEDNHIRIGPLTQEGTAVATYDASANYTLNTIRDSIRNDTFKVKVTNTPTVSLAGGSLGLMNDSKSMQELISKAIFNAMNNNGKNKAVAGENSPYQVDYDLQDLINAFMNGAIYVKEPTIEGVGVLGNDFKSFLQKNR